MEKMMVPMYHVELVRDRDIPYQGINREAAASVFHNLLDSSPIEKMAVIYCNLSMKMIGAEVVSMGTLDMVQTSMTELFRGAILANSPHVWVAHNHVDGLVKASDADYRFTVGAVTAGALLGINIVDHLVIGPGAYWSIKEHQREMLEAVRRLELADRLRGLPPIDFLPKPDRDWNGR